MVGVLQSEAPKIAKLVQITPITMVYGTYNELVIGAYRPINITGGPHFVHIATNFWRNPSLLGDNIHFNISLVDIKLISLFCLVKHVKTPWFLSINGSVSEGFPCGFSTSCCIHREENQAPEAWWIHGCSIYWVQELDGSYFEVVKIGSLIWIGLFGLAKLCFIDLHCLWLQQIIDWLYSYSSKICTIPIFPKLPKTNLSCVCTSPQVHQISLTVQAASSTAATTFTTAMSFFANLASVLRPLREFGFFMGVCVGSLRWMARIGENWCVWGC